MRVVPRRWDNETWVCSIRGHVVPAARVAHLRPTDAALGIHLASGGRLGRCLRCDLWVRSADPAPDEVTAPELPPVAELPHPRRGAQLEDAIVTRLIALERLLHCVLFTSAAIVLALVDSDLGGLRSTSQALSSSLQGMIDNSGRGGSHAWLVRRLDDVQGWHLDLIRVLLVVAIAYALLEGLEAWGLWHERRWAEYLTVVATAGLLPLEIHELTERVTVLRLLALVVNLAVLVWLVWAKHLFGLRGGRASEPAGPDWDSLLAAPPPALEEGVVLTTTVIRAEGVTEHDGLMIDLLADPDVLTWVDSTGPDVGDLEKIRDAFPLHELAVEDVRRHGQRAKLEIYPDHAFLVAYARATDGDLSEVDFFLGPNWLVTVREANDHGEIFDLTEVRARYGRVLDTDRGVGFLLYVLLDALVDGYFDAIEESEDGLEAVEEILFDAGPPPDGSLQQDLLVLRKDLVMFRRRVVPLRDVVLSILRREVEWIEPEAILWFQDVLDHLLRVIDQIDTQRELMGNVVDASLALGANRMNEVMKKMTSWGAILIVATLVAGIYGMNFRNMPELSWHYGYFFALGTMLVTTGGLYLYFKRKGWL